MGTFRLWQSVKYGGSLDWQISPERVRTVFNGRAPKRWRIVWCQRTPRVWSEEEPRSSRHTGPVLSQRSLNV